MSSDRLLRICGEALAELFPKKRLSKISAELSLRWSEKQRSYHGTGHLEALLEQIEAEAPTAKRRALQQVALFHDAVYWPGASDNEARSAALLEGCGAEAVQTAIMESKWDRKPSSALGKLFFEFDTWSLSEGPNAAERLETERGVFKEYQRAGWPGYREGRAAFLKHWPKLFPQHKKGCAAQEEALEAFRPSIAAYPGSFNPFHYGHLSVLREAERIFDQVVILGGINPRKLNEKRMVVTEEQLRFHQVETFPGLLNEFLDEKFPGVTLVRGVRNGTDLEEELKWQRFMKSLAPGSPVVWIGTAPEYQHISSSAIREIAYFNAEQSKQYYPGSAEIYGLVGVF